MVDRRMREIMAPKKMEILVPGSRTREEVSQACKTLSIEPIELTHIEYDSGNSVRASTQSVWRIRGWFYENSKMYMKDPEPWTS